MYIYIYIYIYVYIKLTLITSRKSSTKVSPFRIIRKPNFDSCRMERKIEKKTIEHESDDCTNCDGCFWHSN